MSSHHFVKEGQEPALIIEDVSRPELLNSLLEWAPLVISFDTTLEAIQLLGIKVDVVIADEQKLDCVRHAIEYQMPVKLIGSSKSTMLESALEASISSGNVVVNVCCAEPVNFFSIAEKYLDRLSISLYGNSERWSAVGSKKFEKWLPAGSILHLRGEGPFHLSGNVQETEEKSLEVIGDSVITISSDRLFWVGEVGL